MCGVGANTEKTGTEVTDTELAEALMASVHRRLLI